MAIKKYYTCKTYLKSVDETKVVARLDTDGISAVVTEPGDTYTTEGLFGVKFAHRLSPDRHYLVGEIAERLYAYEQLGYEPEELKKFLDERERLTNAYYIYTGRQNGKTELQRRMYAYILNDCNTPVEVVDFRLRNKASYVGMSRAISKVIFNEPATIVFWGDGTKTVVKAHDETFDPEKGLAMAIAKKFFGNEGNYFNQIKKWTEKYETPKNLDANTIKALGEKLVEGFLDGIEESELPWKIWVEFFDDDGEPIASAVLPNEYKNKGSATRAARKQFDYRVGIKWTVSQTNPWTEDNKEGK